MQIIKIKLFKWLFSENEKCMLNQALNLLVIEIKEDCISPDYKQDLSDAEYLRKMCENKLWN